MANDFGIAVADNNLLEDLARAEGMEVMDMIEMSVFDSVVPGICPRCKGTQECEPDARANWCEECQDNTVRSCLDIAGMI